MGPELVGQLISEFPLFLYIRTEKAQRLTDQQDQLTYCMFTLGTEVIRSTSSDHISLPTLGTEGDQRLTYSIE